MRRCFALISLLAALSSFPLLADDPLPPQHTFGPDTTRTGLFTGTGTALGLTCNASAAPMECSGFLASDVDGTALDVTLKIPGGTAPFPLVVNLHGYGGSKQSDSSWDDKLLLRGYAVVSDFEGALIMVAVVHRTRPFRVGILHERLYVDVQR